MNHRVIRAEVCYVRSIREQGLSSIPLKEFVINNRTYCRVRTKITGHI